MKQQQKLFAAFILVGLTALPALGQMAGMSGGKMPDKSTPAKAAAKKMAMCCMGGMKMDKMMSGQAAADKKMMGKCCMAGMKTAGMKPGGMKMGDMKMNGMSAADKKKMGMCCMAGMKAAGMKPGSKSVPSGMDAKK